MIEHLKLALLARNQFEGDHEGALTEMEHRVRKAIESETKANIDDRDITDDTIMDERADELGVARLAKAMLAKLKEKRLEGYHGWNNDCTVEHLQQLFVSHIGKPWTERNLIDMANFCMMLWNRERPHG
jgi:hypothetical protein